MRVLLPEALPVGTETGPQNKDNLRDEKGKDGEGSGEDDAKAQDGKDGRGRGDVRNANQGDHHAPND